ncbi:Ssl1-like-domain-containing protein [Pavlovales sp. CCMP2436]|nr:Ssl1-like-domain-containing protein [Pavlovales sp. CCMP2436]
MEADAEQPEAEVQPTGSEVGADDAYAWERRYERTWEDIAVGADGILRIQQPEGADWRLQSAGFDLDARRGVIRHVLLLWDISKSAGAIDGDLKPSRAVATAGALIEWVDEFFDKNPISRLGIIVVGKVQDSVSGVVREMEAGAELWSQMSSNPEDHIGKLRAFREQPLCDGHFSMQNALDLACAVLMPMPAYGTREVLCLVSSLSSQDPGDVKASIRRVEERNIRCSVLALQAETYICRLLAKRTHGSFAVICDYDHLQQELRYQLAAPPIATVGSGVAKCLIQMGLPSRATSKLASLCACHGTLTRTGYACPQCGAKHCGLPTCCVVCGLVLVSSQHLARSTRHLFLLPPFSRAAAVLEPEESGALAGCGACFSALEPGHSVWQCARCRAEYCEACNTYMHDVLNNCPTCDGTGMTGSAS